MTRMDRNSVYFKHYFRLNELIFFSNNDKMFESNIFLTNVFNANVAFINTASLVCNCRHKSSRVDGQPFRVFIIRVLFHVVKINSLNMNTFEVVLSVQVQY